MQATLVALQHLFVLPKFVLKLHNLLVSLETPAGSCKRLDGRGTHVLQSLPSMACDMITSE
jgi:hypothetical protein